MKAYEEAIIDHYERDECDRHHGYDGMRALLRFFNKL